MNECIYGLVWSSGKKGKKRTDKTGMKKKKNGRKLRTQKWNIEWNEFKGLKLNGGEKVRQDECGCIFFLFHLWLTVFFFFCLSENWDWMLVGTVFDSSKWYRAFLFNLISDLSTEKKRKLPKKLTTTLLLVCTRNQTKNY